MKKHIKYVLFALPIALLLFWPNVRMLHAQGGHSVTLTWKAPTTGGAATSYNVKRSTSAGTEVTIGTSTLLTYVDSTGVGGTTYFYVVTAVNSAGESSPSNELSATFLATVPGAPGSLAATSN